MKNSIRLLVLVLVLSSCNSGNKNKDTYSSIDKTETTINHLGKALMETNCYTCHSPTATQKDRIGPPMVAIKKHYIDNTTTKDQFVEAMQAWIKNPNKDDAKMRGAVKRFGVMPKQHFPEETIAQIADYMFDFEIEQPAWFEDHFNGERGKGNGMRHGKDQGNGNGKGKQQAQTNFENLPNGERGLKYALSTKAVLGKNLMGTIQQKGILEALAFCNVQAYPLTDSMAVVHNATIKRVTDKPRNPINKANAEELEYINTYKKVIAKNEEAKPIVKELDNQVNVYYPITTNAMCIQCHGVPNKTMDSKTFKEIKNLYPKDLAIGYEENQVRGIWHVTFDKKE